MMAGEATAAVWDPAANDVVDGQGARGYFREDFEEVFGRYLPPVSENLRNWLEGKESKGPEGGNEKAA